MPCLHPLPAGLPGIIPSIPHAPSTAAEIGSQLSANPPGSSPAAEVRRPDLAARFKKCELNPCLGPALRSLPVWLISAPTLF